MAGRVFDPIEIPTTLWERREVVQALGQRDVGRVFQLVRQHAGASQTRIAIATGMSQGQVSEIMNGARRITAIDLLERIADGLDMPDEARMLLGLAPTQRASAGLISAPDTRPTFGSASLYAPRSVESSEELEDDPVRRRTFLGLTGAGLFGAVLSEPADGGPASATAALADALVGYPDATNTAAVSDLRILGQAVAAAKQSYQACRYSVLAEDLPQLLATVNTARGNLDGDERLRAEALSAEAHHAAASVLLKLGDDGLAWVAADRSMQAAHRSEDPLMVASSARIITHALMNGHHLGQAKTMASTMAARLDAKCRKATPASLSVYGSLLLRGAIAAAQQHDRATAMELLDEAGEAAGRLGGDHNHRWTAFGPTNVALHRVSIAVTLGDAGTAIDHARRVDPDRITVVERKASLLIDAARAFTQWGRYDRAYHVLCAAEQLAREEVSARPSARALVADLLTRVPRSLQPQARELAERIGVAA